MRAGKGGTVALNDRYYSAGEFIPYYVPRQDMPQIDPNVLDQLLEYAKQWGVAISKGECEPGYIHPRQHVNMHRVRALTAEMLNSPTLISSDRLILDGNHRWMGHVLAKTPVPFIMFGLSFEDAINFLLSFPETREASS